MNFRKSLLTSIGLFLFLGNIFGGTVETSIARQVGANWFTSVNHLKSAKVLSLVYAKENAFYVFGNESSFVIISADDRIQPVLGYSNEGPFVLPSANDSTGNNFWGMLSSYEKQIAYVVDNNIAATGKIANQWKNLKNGNTLKSASIVVSPLLTTNWYQGSPYNALCPTDLNGPGGHVAVGCVGLAVAQILKYYNYPNQGLGTYGYQSGIYPNTTANFGSTTYNWTNMPNSISTQNNDVATLIYQAAVSVRSSWGPENTTAISTNVVKSFVNYFRCAFSTIQYVQKNNYTIEQWDNLLQNELRNNRPIYYAGYGTGDGHAWVCDGVDANNMYHFNLGWGGANNGYFSLTAITPATHNYTDRQEAIIGIQPNDGSTLVTNTLWSGNVSNLTNIAVPDAVTLTVNAGALVKFTKDTKLQIFGKIVSTGTANNYATFTAADTTTGWWGIKFDNSYMNSEVMMDNDTSRFIYSQIQYSDMRGISIQKFNKVVIDHCIINNNYIDKNEDGYNGLYGCGAGVFAGNSIVKITYSKLYKNSATIFGGGLYVDGDDNFITNIFGNKIFQNFAGEGGGFYLSHTSVFSNNVVYNNRASSGAGGAFVGGLSLSLSQMSVINNMFCNNIASDFGGGLYIEKCSPQVIDNLLANNISGNSSFGKGGGIFFTQYSSPRLINNTIVNNKSYQGGALCLTLNYDGIVTVKNCLIYGNSAIKYGNQIVLGQTDADPIIDHSNIQGGVSAFGGPGAGTNYTTANYMNNIDSNPLFVSPSAGAGSGYDGMTANWQLSSTSPSVNAGDVTGLSLPTKDLAGNARINGVIDMGAYESSVSTNTNNVLGELSKSARVYPNPVANELIIEFAGNTQNSDFEVINSLGQIVSSGKLFEKTVVSTVSFTSGVYLVKLKSGEVIEFKKIVKK